MIITVTGHSNENESSDEEDDQEKQVCNSEAAECFKNCLSWTQRQNNVDPPMFYFHTRSCSH